MPQQEDIAPHVEELARALQDVPEEKIRKELERWLEHGVPLHQAKRDILTSLGGSRQVSKTVDELTAQDNNVDLVARVLSVDTRQITARGEERTIWEGEIADETGRVSYTSWRELDQLQPGNVIELKGAYVRTWQGQPQVNIGDNAEISQAEDDAVPPADDLPDTQPTATVEHQGPTGGRELDVEALEPGQSSVTVKGRLLSVDDRTVNVKGEPKTIWEGEIADETGKVAFTSWHDHQLEPGQAVEISNAYVRTFRGAVQLNFGENSLVETLDDDAVPPADQIDDAQALTTGAELKEIKALTPGMDTIAIQGRLLSVNDRQVEVKGEPKTLWEGEIADETGRVTYTCWEDHGLAEGDIVRIDNCYVRSFRGLANVNFGEHAQVKALADDTLPPAKQLKRHKPYTIAELERIQGAIGVEVEALVLEVRDGSGLILRCPECRRVLQEGECRLHGRVQGLHDLRVKAVVDDGTGAITAFFDRTLTEEILGKDLEAAQQAAQDAMDRTIIHEEIRQSLTLKRVTVRGNATHDDYGTTLIVDGFERTEPEDITGRAEELMDEIHVLQEEVSA